MSDIGKINVLIMAFGKSVHPTTSVNKQIVAFSNQAKVKENYLEVFSGISVVSKFIERKGNRMHHLHFEATKLKNMEKLISEGFN